MQQEERIEEIIAYYAAKNEPARQENLAAMLREIQEEQGCISREIQSLAAQRLGIKTSVLACLIKFYPDLKEAKYRHEILLCTGERCRNKGSQELVEFLKKELKIRKNGVSADGKIYLQTVGCLRKCPTAPNVKIDGKIYENVNKKQLLALLREQKCAKKNFQ